MLGTLLAKVIGTQNDRELKRLRPLVEQVNALEPSVKQLTDEQLRLKTPEFRERLAKGEALNDLMPEAFAIVREAGRRVLNMRHFDVQIIGGAVLHSGAIAEMKTGEGKTLVATRSEEHTSELQSQSNLVCRLLLEKKKQTKKYKHNKK